ncbi:hypothetical protein BH11PLA1_BH11PLA1_00370 [soil metagenome]
MPTRAEIRRADMERPPRGCTVVIDGDTVVLRARYFSVVHFAAIVLIAVLLGALIASGITVWPGAPRWIPLAAVAGGLILLVIHVALQLAGVLLIRIAPTEGEVDFRAGLYRRVQTFDPRRVYSMGVESETDDETVRTEIIVRAATTLRFARYLERTRREWLSRVMRELLIDRRRRERSTQLRGGDLTLP